MLLYLLGAAAIALTIASEVADKSVLGLLAGIMWMFTGGDALANQSVSILYLYLGVASVLIGITLGIVNTVSINTGNRKRREEIEARIELENPSSFDNQVIKARRGRKEASQKRKDSIDQSSEEWAIRRENAEARKYL